MSKIAKDKSETVSRIPSACAHEDAAVKFLEAERWGETPECAHCGSEDVYQMKSRDGSRNKRFLWRCRDCGQQYTVRIGTVFEDSRIPLKHWCYAFWRACSSKKGVSALEIKRQTGLSYKSALFMMHRIRFAMSDDGAEPEPMKGDIEVDETYVVGRFLSGYKVKSAAKELATSFDAFIERSLASGISNQSPYEFLADLKAEMDSRFSRDYRNNK